MRPDREVGRRSFLSGLGALASSVGAAAGLAGAAPARPLPETPRGPHAEDTRHAAPADNDATTSTFFATVAVDSSYRVTTDSDGDLWPTCWADDDALYTANGDGGGFGTGRHADIVVNRITGDPETGLAGQRLAAGNAVGTIWGDASVYNRKPTGITCADGRLYLAVQDLRSAPAAQAFDDAPYASMSWSDDHGRTWQQTQQPMFTDGVFTTIFFLDFGRNGRAAQAALGPQAAGYVYAYGMDGNWRGSFSGAVADPVDLYLARAPKDAVQQRSRWEFFAGTNGEGPVWSPRLTERRSVLHDTRRQYPSIRNADGHPHNLSVISQGGVLYVEPLRRYVYTSWTEYTFEFYESPTPWGPWKLFFTKDFGGYPWYGRGPRCPGPKNGGYATTIPSKFVAADGLSLWVQANWWVGNDCGEVAYRYSLRKLQLRPFVAQTPTNQPDPRENLSVTDTATPIEKSAHYGHPERYHDGDLSTSEDSFDQENKNLDWWGITWAQPYRFNAVVYTTGEMFDDGGWFAASLRVQVRQNFRWVDVANADLAPRYPYSSAAGPYRSFTFRFATTSGDGVRVIGKPGGSSYFTSIAELEVYYRSS